MFKELTKRIFIYYLFSLNTLQKIHNDFESSRYPNDGINIDNNDIFFSILKEYDYYQRFLFISLLLYCFAQNIMARLKIRGSVYLNIKYLGFLINLMSTKNQTNLDYFDYYKFLKISLNQIKIESPELKIWIEKTFTSILFFSNSTTINLSNMLIDEKFFRSNLYYLYEYLIETCKLLLNESTDKLQHVLWIINEIMTLDIIPDEYKLILMDLYHKKIKS